MKLKTGLPSPWPSGWLLENKHLSFEKHILHFESVLPWKVFSVTQIRVDSQSHVASYRVSSSYLKCMETKRILDFTFTWKVDYLNTRCLWFRTSDLNRKLFMVLTPAFWLWPLNVRPNMIFPTYSITMMLKIFEFCSTLDFVLSS